MTKIKIQKNKNKMEEIRIEVSANRRELNDMYIQGPIDGITAALCVAIHASLREIPKDEKMVMINVIQKTLFEIIKES